MSQVTDRISETCDNTYAEAMDCVAFWRGCLAHPNMMGDSDGSDVLRWISYEIEATCEAIGFASRSEG